MSSALSFGNFDGLHLGHLKIFAEICYLKQSFDLKTSLVVTFNPHPACYFGRKRNFLIVNQKTKVELIKKYVDNLHLLRFDFAVANHSPKDFIDWLCKKFEPKFIVVGQDCRFGKGASGNIKLLQNLEKKYQFRSIVVEPLLRDGLVCSSTKIRGFLQSGEIKSCNKLLGRSYSVFGCVKKDRCIGQKIGFPTVNLYLDRDLIHPKLGVYLGSIKITNRFFYGIINIGTRPTTTSESKVVLEMHIFDFNHCIYGQEVEIYFLDFIRDEVRFDSLNTLKKQIAKDIEFAKDALKSQCF